MNAKTKNWIVFNFQIQFFTILTIIIIFLEVASLFEVLFDLNPSTSHPSTRTAVPSVQDVIFSISFVILMLLNLSMAIFSMYGFIFILHVLDSNPTRTAPVCPFAIDFALINLFFCHFSLYKERYFTYFAPYFPLSICFHIPNLISQISEILMIISFFTIFINLQFGIHGFKKRRIIKTNIMTDFIHILLIINGVLAIYFLFLYIYTNILIINLIGFVLSAIFALFLIGFFNFVLRKKKLEYPLEAIARWRERQTRKKSIK